MKKTALILIPILILLVSGWFFFLRNGTSSSPATVVPTPTFEVVPIQDLAETNPYGIDLTPRYDKKAAFLKITAFPEDLKTIEYELTYEAREGPRGVLGTINYQGEEKIQREILLGTCSKNVCRYDEGVKEILLTVVFRGEKVEKFQDEFSLK